MKTSLFISKAKGIHNNYYDYSFVDYINNHTKVKIICPIHGVFEQSPHHHINRGSRCPSCSGHKMNTNTFIDKAKLIHNDRYDYSLVDYKTSQTKVKIICPLHGIFEQTPNAHLSKKNCNKCCGTPKKNTTQFIIEATNKHGNKYGYSLVKYIKNSIKIEIICPTHGVFKQTPLAHLSGQGCPKCGFIVTANKVKITTEEFIKRANIKHIGKYNYSLTKYNGWDNKVKIICLEHGLFNQKAGAHLQGCGCPVCNNSKGEREVRKYLLSKNIKFLQQYKFEKCRNINPLPFDFYLPDYNICIEFNGIQHYEPKKSFNSKCSFGSKNDIFKNIVLRDKIKKEYCKINNIGLLIIKYSENILNTLSDYFDPINSNEPHIRLLSK